MSEVRALVRWAVQGVISSNSCIMAAVVVVGVVGVRAINWQGKRYDW